MFKFRSMTFRARLTTYLVCLAAAISLITISLIYQQMHRALRDQIRSRLICVARTGALMVDTGKLAALVNPADEATNSYVETKRTLQAIRDSNPDIRYVYIMARTGKPHTWKFLVDAETDSKLVSHLGDLFDVSPYPEMQRAFEVATADREINRDPWGYWLSGYAPIRDENGKAVAILGLDMSAKSVITEERELALFAIVSVGMAVLLSALLGRFLASRLSKPLEGLIKATHQVAAGDLGLEVPVAGDGELGVLAQSFNKMTSEILVSHQQLEKELQAARWMNIITHGICRRQAVQETLRLIAASAQEILDVTDCTIIPIREEKPLELISSDHQLADFQPGPDIDPVLNFLTHSSQPLVLDARHQTLLQLGGDSSGSTMAFSLTESNIRLGAMILKDAASRVFADAEIDRARHLADLAAIAIANSDLFQDLTEQATIDSLTGLINHRHFQAKLEEEIIYSRSDRQTVSLVIIDLDFFHTFNNLYGHSAGDRALSDVAKIFSSNLRPTDTAARYGGEEFALILPRVSGPEAAFLAQKIRREVEAFPFTTDGNHQASLTVSIGISTFPADAATKQELLERAALALGFAKIKGRNQVRLYHADRDNIINQTPQEAIRSKLLLSGVYALAAAVDARDHYTHQHSQSVAKYAAAIAASMGLSEQDVDNISIAGLLHDVGKIGVSDAILSKSGPLTPEEWQEMITHPTIASNILGHISGLEGIIPMILHHHERYDGKGYPDGLAGEQISIGARIIAVADAYHAMTTDRPYHKALGQEQALGELMTCRNTQLDPVIVQHFMSVLHRESIQGSLMLA